MVLARTIHLVAIDQVFRNAFRVDPKAALTNEGMVLEPDLIWAIMRVLENPSRVHNLLTDMKSGPGEQEWA